MHAQKAERFTIADRILLIISIVMLGAAATMALLTSAGYSPLPAQNFCWSQLLLGEECPGCGLSRSFVALAMGRIERAFALNPIGPPLFAILLIVVATRIAKRMGLPWPRNADAALAIVTLLFLVIRTFLFYSGR